MDDRYTLGISARKETITTCGRDFVLPPPKKYLESPLIFVLTKIPFSLFIHPKITFGQNNSLRLKHQFFKYPVVVIKKFDINFIEIG